MTLPLKGLNILITRGAHQATQLSKLVKEFGGIPLEVPLLTYKVVENNETKQIINHLNRFEWIIFTSVNGVHFFFEILNRNQVEFPKGKKIGVVGSKTAEALNGHGYSIDYIPNIYSADAMADNFSTYYREGTVLLVQGNLSRDVLPNYFKSNHIPFEAVVVYETRINDKERANLKHTLSKRIDVISFTSPSTVNAFCELSGERMGEYLDTLCLCIGTTTRDAAIQRGFTRVIYPEQFTVNDMILALINYMKEQDNNGN